MERAALLSPTSPTPSVFLATDSLPAGIIATSVFLCYDTDHLQHSPSHLIRLFSFHGTFYHHFTHYRQPNVWSLLFTYENATPPLLPDLPALPVFSHIDAACCGLPHIWCKINQKAPPRLHIIVPHHTHIFSRTIARLLDHPPSCIHVTGDHLCAFFDYATTCARNFSLSDIFIIIILSNPYWYHPLPNVRHRRSRWSGIFCPVPGSVRISAYACFLNYHFLLWIFLKILQVLSLYNGSL